MAGSLKNVNVKSDKQAVDMVLIMTRMVTKVTLNIDAEFLTQWGLLAFYLNFEVGGFWLFIRHDGIIVDNDTLLPQTLRV